MKSVTTYVSQSRHRNFSAFCSPWRHLQNGDHPGAIGNNNGLVIDEGKTVGAMQTWRFHSDATGQIHALAGCRNGDFHIDHQNLVPGVSGNRQTSVARRKLHISRAPQVGEGLPYLRGSSEVHLHADASPSYE